MRRCDKGEIPFSGNSKWTVIGLFLAHNWHAPENFKYELRKNPYMYITVINNYFFSFINTRHMFIDFQSTYPLLPLRTHYSALTFATIEYFDCCSLKHTEYLSVCRVFLQPRQTFVLRSSCLQYFSWAYLGKMLHT